MNLLLDTHLFLWFIAGDSRLPKPIERAVREPMNRVYLSVAAVWECVIKVQIGRLVLPGAPVEYLPRRRAEHGIDTLPIVEEDLATLATLPLLHRDPFDRIVIAQAVRHDFTMATLDERVPAYAAHGLRILKA